MLLVFICCKQCRYKGVYGCVCMSTIISASISVEKILRHAMNSSASMYVFLHSQSQIKSCSFICSFAFSRNVVKKQKPMTKRMHQSMYQVQPTRMERQVDFSVLYQPVVNSCCCLLFGGSHHQVHHCCKKERSKKCRG